MKMRWMTAGRSEKHWHNFRKGLWKIMSASTKKPITIVEEADGEGASRWGLLKSYQEKRDGRISLDYGKRV